MKVATGLSFFGLLVSTIFAAPSLHQKKDVNIFVYEETPAVNSKSSEITLSSLESGTYVITSPGLDSDKVIGRFITEDLSLLPKRVLTESRSLPSKIYKWSVESLPDNKFRLSVLGAPVKNINGNLYAILIGDTDSEWIINPRGPGIFSIEDGNGLAWVAGTDELDQVGVRPNDGSPQTLFKFTRVDGDFSQHKNEHENTAQKMIPDVEVPEEISQGPFGYFPPGPYAITSPVLPPGFNIGRSSREDRSLLPKRIVTSPADYTQNWVVEQLPNGMYQLTSGRAPVTNIEGRIYALLLPIPDLHDWFLKPREDNTFTIEDGEGNAWVANPEPGEQVGFAPIGSSIAPNQLFKFTPINDGAATSTRTSKLDIKLIIEEL
jgi:hypothetical protein